jgi:D-threo-aldose 1-dehydrogenase
MRDFIATGEFAAVLNHNRFTLVDRSAEPLMDDACERGVAFLNGAPYGGGILVKGPDAQPKYAYRPASEKVAGAVRAMQEACASCGVPLAAAALQFSVRDPRVTSTVVGVSEPSRIAEITELTQARIPDVLWQQLGALAAPPELWLN